MGSKILQGWNNVLQESVCALNQQPICGTASPIDRIHGAVIRGINGRETALFRDPLGTFLHPVLQSVGSETGHIFQRRNAPTMGQSNGSLKVEA